MTGRNYLIWNSQRLEDVMFWSKKKCYFITLHVQMLPYFLYLLGPFILRVQPRERAKAWSLGLASGVLASSLFIRHRTYVNEHSFYSARVTHLVQRISPPCTLYLLLFFKNASAHRHWGPVASHRLHFQKKRRNYSFMENVFWVYLSWKHRP